MEKVRNGSRIEQIRHIFADSIYYMESKEIGGRHESFKILKSGGGYRDYTEQAFYRQVKKKAIEYHCMTGIIKFREGQNPRLQDIARTGSGKLEIRSREFLGVP